ncbi:MAG: HAD-IA family hydrolase [Spirochaetales bacterium]|nr:HAD-IA family hydrolase [Spirochaetales bacterium]
MNFEWDCYLFDADGTLVDTRDLIFECFKFSLRDRKLINPLTRANLDHMIGIPYRTQLEYYLGRLTDLQYAEIRDEHIVHQDQLAYDYISLCPGVKETLEFLKQKGKKLGIVTSRSRVSLFPFFKHLGIYEYFDLYVTPHETDKHKPEPEPVLKALELFGVDQKDAVFVGDAVFDIESGARAGVKTVFVNWSPVDLSLGAFMPDFRIDDMRELIF